MKNLFSITIKTREPHQAHQNANPFIEIVTVNGKEALNARLAALHEAGAEIVRVCNGIGRTIN